MDVDTIFSAARAFSSEIIRLDKIRDARLLLRDADRKECGHCCHWMKSTCKPEKEGGQIKSCSSPPCKGFQRSQWNVALVEQRKKELSAMTPKNKE